MGSMLEETPGGCVGFAVVDCVVFAGLLNVGCIAAIGVEGCDIAGSDSAAGVAAALEPFLPAFFCRSKC